MMIATCVDCRKIRGDLHMTDRGTVCEDCTREYIEDMVKRILGKEDTEGED